MVVCIYGVGVGMVVLCFAYNGVLGVNVLDIYNHAGIFPIGVEFLVAWQDGALGYFDIARWYLDFHGYMGFCIK